MTIEIHNTELEALLQRQLEAGNFASIEQLLLETFRGLQAEVPGEVRKAKALEAAARIRELRKGISLNRPQGVSLREYAHIGHKC